MDEALKLLLALLKSDPEKAIAEIRNTTKETDQIKKYTDEYIDLDRTQRESQLGTIQKNKSLSGNKTQKMVKIVINHAQNIVETLSAFVVGKPVTLVPSVVNPMSDLMKHVWRTNRMDAKILDSLIIRMSQTQVAMNFYIKDVNEVTSILNKILINLKLKAQAKEIKVKVLDNLTGVMTPYFDSSGDMILFMWQYKNKIDGKTVNHAEVYDETNRYYLNDATAKMLFIEGKPHGFDRIPIVYDSQKKPQWYRVNNAIDRHEVAMSKLGDSNDYSGHPILVTEGEVKNMPLKEDSGKHFNIPVTFDKDKNEIKGKVSFLEAQTAPASNKLEIDKLEDVIAYGSSVPNLSFEKLKSLGNVAEKTVKLMFLATEMKSELLRSQTRTFIERCLNILTSGIVKTTNTALSKDAELLYYEIHFNSILPSDMEERVSMVTEAVEAGLMSKATGIGLIDLVDDVEDEMALIEAEQPEEPEPEPDPNPDEK